MGNAASSAAPAGQAGDLRSSLANVTQERDMYKNEVFKQKSEMWELEDKYKDIKSRAEWAFNITFVSVILGAGYAAWTIRHHKNTVRKLALDIKEVRRRALIDVEDARKFGVAPLAKDILSAADDLERAACYLYLPIDTAEKSASEAPAVATLLEGVKLTEKSLQAALARHGVCKLSPLGEPFDPHVHEAMLTIQDDTKEGDTVGVVLQNGYTLHDRVLRAAKVGVVKRADADDDEGRNVAPEDSK